MSERLPEALRLAVVELTAIQGELKQPITEEVHLESIWVRLTALRRQLPGLERRLGRERDRAILGRCRETLDGLAAALAPVREERQATRALKDAIQTFEERVNRPSAQVKRPEEATRLLETLEQLRWKLDAIPAGDGPDDPRIQALASLREAMDFARRKLERRSTELEGLAGVSAAERVLNRIVSEAGDLDDPEQVTRVFSRLASLERSLETTRSTMEDGDTTTALDRVGDGIEGVRKQLRGIVESREAARVIRNAIHGYNAALKTFDRGPTTTEMAENLREHFEVMAGELEGVRKNAMPEELRAQHKQIHRAVREALTQLAP